MKTLVLILSVLTVGLLATGFKISGAGENRPTVQSALNGAFYVRSVPKADSGSEGKTQVFKVKKDGDELLDEYPVYMRGELYLGWSPIAGKYCLVHVEPERITRDDDMLKIGKVSRLAFYMGGTELCAYTRENLEKMGFKEKVQTLVNRQSGQYVVHGIRQIPRTNNYVFELERTVKGGRDTETLMFDITTGKVFGGLTEEKAEQSAGAAPAGPGSAQP